MWSADLRRNRRRAGPIRCAGRPARRPLGGRKSMATAVLVEDPDAVGQLIRAQVFYIAVVTKRLFLQQADLQQRYVPS